MWIKARQKDSFMNIQSGGWSLTLGHTCGIWVYRHADVSSTAVLMHWGIEGGCECNFCHLGASTVR